MRRSQSQIAVACLSLALMAYGGICSANMNSQEHGGLLHVIETDSYLYELPEFVHIGYTVTNVSGDSLVVRLAWCSCPIPVSVDSPSASTVWCSPCGCSDETCRDTLAVGEAYSKDVVWDMYDLFTGELIEELGVYSVSGRLSTYDPDLTLTIYLDIEIQENATAVPEPAQPNSWTTIKAMCR